VIPAFNIMKDHIQDQLRIFNTNDFLQLEDIENERSRLQTNIMNADAKLKKYRALLTSLVYYVAVILVPWTKWHYFEDHLTEEELSTAKKAIQKLWEDDYAQIPIEIKDISIDITLAQVS
jgi:hypothetical protein